MTSTTPLITSNRCAATIIAYGVALYELVYLYPADTPVAAGFELHSMYPPTVLQREGRLVQHVPQRFQSDGKLGQFVELDPTRLAIFNPPTPYRKYLEEAISSLVLIEHSRNSKLALESLQVGTKELPYEFLVHKRSEHAAVAEATKGIGWDARGTFREGQTEYYLLYRN